LVRNLPESKALVSDLLLSMLEQRLVFAEGGDLGEADDLPEVEIFILIVMVKVKSVENDDSSQSLKSI